MSPSFMPYPTTALHAIRHPGFLLNICPSWIFAGESNSIPLLTATTQVAHVPSEPQSPDPPESNRSACFHQDLMSKRNAEMDSNPSVCVPSTKHLPICHSTSLREQAWRDANSPQQTIRCAHLSRSYSVDIAT